MANSFLDATDYAKTMLLLVKNNLVMGRLVQGRFKNEVTDENGLSVNIKRPPRFAQNDSSTFSAALDTQDIVIGSINLQVNQYAKVHLSIGDIEYVQHVNDLVKNETMKSAGNTLAQQFDKFLANKTLGFNSFVAGNTTTGGISAADISVAIKSPGQLGAAYTRLQDMGVPGDSLVGIVTPIDGELIRASLIASNIQSENAQALHRAYIPVVSDINWYSTQNVPALTVGSRVATATTAINNGTLSKNYRDVKDAYYQDITIDGQSGSKTIKAGESLTIAAVNDYDWRNQVALPYLKVFTVVSDVTLSSGAGTIRITPPLIVAGTSDGVDTKQNTAHATVDAAAVNDAVVTHLGTASTAYRIRSAWRKNGIEMVSARLRQPETGTFSYARDKETGIEIRYWRGSDISTGAHLHRWDAIFGAVCTDPEMGVHIVGS